MRLSRLETDAVYVERYRADLEVLARQPPIPHHRPCPGCTDPCPCSESTSCTCRCSSHCDHAPRVLSSEPELYPIEKGVLPLVFELNCLEVCRPFWSCEGHEDDRGVVTRIPRVWFYARSLVYPRLVDDHLHGLRIAETLAYPWRVCLTYSEDDNVDTAFSIEPDLSFKERPKLAPLRSDLGVIADSIAKGIRGRAVHYLRTIPPMRRDPEKRRLRPALFRL